MVLDSRNTRADGQAEGGHHQNLLLTALQYHSLKLCLPSLCVGMNYLCSIIFWIILWLELAFDRFHGWIVNSTRMNVFENYWESFFENVNIHRNYVVGELVIDSSSSSRNETLREKTFFYCRPKCKVRNGSRTKCQSYYRNRPWVLQPISNCLVNRDPICALEYFMRGSCIYQKKKNF